MLIGQNSVRTSSVTHRVIPTLFIAISGCVSNGDDTVPDINTNKPIEQLKSVMKQTEEAKTIYLGSTSSSDDYIVVSEERWTKSGEWLTYTPLLLEKNKEGNVTKIQPISTTYVKKGQKESIKFEPSVQQPRFSWSFKQGGNLSADVQQGMAGAKVEFKADHIYKFAITKVGDIVIDKQALDATTYEYNTFMNFYERYKKQDENLYYTYAKTRPIAQSLAIYDIDITKYEKTDVTSDANIAGLVKANGVFYKDQGHEARTTIAKLYYIIAAYPSYAVRQKIIKEFNDTGENEKILIKEVLNKPTSELTPVELIDGNRTLEKLNERLLKVN
ncbi:hypothetical protein L2D36_14220 [Vibrio harveyi]|uniref:hypothetical protein n=1 Tax=Vibrio TaxID=662 RepID=UPI0022CD9575|nr:hypothetical protein [Vibrio sp. NFR]MDA0134707.1 hypothetical protein [Vibrio sp. NFR]